MTAKRKKAADSGNERIAIIRTSDRQGFKRCRRRWNFQSHLRQNLDQLQRPSYFWLGTGGHFAMEDWHGYNYYGHPVEAFRAYVEGCKRAAKKHRIQLPDDYTEQVELGEGILNNYLLWCEHRDPYETVWIDGEPQVEQVIFIDITPYLSQDSGSNGDGHQIVGMPHWSDNYDKVVYRITLDRLIKHEGEYWILDWKFLRSFETNALEFDNQMTAYIWGASTVYNDFTIAGAIKHQFRKEIPKSPRILANGKISTAKDQMTTHGLYRDALMGVYGKVSKAPLAMQERLNELATRENEDRDDFIKRDRTRRTPPEMEAEGTKIFMEAEDMLDPHIPCYMNATRDCNWDCQMQEVCLMIDRDEDWETFLKQVTVSRTEESDEWRHHLPK